MFYTSEQSIYCNFVLDLGFIDYCKAYEIQKQILEEVKLDSRPNTVILAEHPHVFTIGRTGRRENILVDENVLSKEGIRVCFVDRGGDVTYHGPGQLLIYPIIDLKKMGMRIHSFLQRLEELAIGFLNEYGISGERKNGLRGIWVNDRKIASIGIGVSSWVTYHGLAININPELRYFSMINPCGIPDSKITSLTNLLGKKISIEETKDSLLKAEARLLTRTLLGLG